MLAACTRAAISTCAGTAVEQAARQCVDQLVGQRDLALAREQLGQVRIPNCVPLGSSRMLAGYPAG